jgi:hypothetical protein
MGTDLSPGELLLHSYHGRCGHRRQSGLPCATPGCKAGDMWMVHIAFNVDGPGSHRYYERTQVEFGDEKHYVWRKI